MKTFWIFVSLLASLLLISGCSPSNVKLYEGSELPDDQVSKLTTDSKNVTIEKINNKSFFTMGDLWDGKWNAIVSVKPGEHHIEAKYWNGPTLDEHIMSHYLFKAETLAGNKYIVRHKIINKSVALWIESTPQGEKLGISSQALMRRLLT